MKQKYHVELSEDQRDKLEKLRRKKQESFENKKRAGVLLDLDESKGRKPQSTAQIAARNGVSEETVRICRKRFATEGLEKTICRKKRKMPPVAPKVTGEVEAHIIATCCSAAPEGKTRWTAQMIANKIIVDGIVDSISDDTVLRVLKKLHLNHI